MKFARGFVVVSLIGSSLSLAIACGGPVDSNLFSARGGASDPGVAGAESADAGQSSGGAKEHAGTGGSLGGIAGHPSTGDAGENGIGSSGSSDGGGMSAAGKSAGGSMNAGAGGNAAGRGGSGSGGHSGASAGTSGTSGASGASGSSVGGGGASGASGSSGSSGSGGSNHSGGAGGGPVCPSSPPSKNESCDVVTPNSCFYPGQACSCLPSTAPGINSAKTWACYGDGAACPDAKPIPGASCKASVGAECPYPGNDFCVCSGSSFGTYWVCQSALSVCPAKKPMDPYCNAVKTCSWGSNKEVACFCNGERWGCEGGF